MCTGFEIAALALGGFSAVSQLTQKPQKPAEPPAPVALPQASTAPTPKTYAAANAAQAIAGGPTSTLLTSTTGVGDTSLGKSTLLGA